MFKLPAFALGVCKLAGKISSRRGHIPSIPGDVGYNTLFCHLPVMYLKLASIQGGGLSQYLCVRASFVSNGEGLGKFSDAALYAACTSFCFLAVLVKQESYRRTR